MTFYKTLISVFTYVIIPHLLFAGNDNHSIGARSGALGNASVALSDVWSVHHNQAGLSRLEKASVGVFYENRFLLSELSLQGIAVAVPVPGKHRGVFGLSASYLGYSQYNDSKVGLSYAMPLGEKLFAGVQLDYLSTRIGEGYGSRNYFVAEMGLQAKVSEDIFLGAHVFNPTRTKKATYTDERIPTIFRVGMQYIFSEKVFIAFETEKDIEFAPVYKAGVEYRVVEQLYLRGGIATNPLYNTFGFGLLLKDFMIDVSASRHQVLGFTPQFSISYKFK